jgi:hypothetical protein
MRGTAGTEARPTSSFLVPKLPIGNFLWAKLCFAGLIKRRFSLFTAGAQAELGLKIRVPKQELGNEIMVICK